MGQLDQEAIRRVREQAWPEVESVDELHDALLLLGFMTQGEMRPFRHFLSELLGLKRATEFFVTPGYSLFIACERLPQFQAIMPGRSIRPVVEPPPRERDVEWTPEDALREIIRSRLEGLGPVTVGRLADSIGMPERAIDQALIALEGEGFAIRGQFEFRDGAVEWCDRRLLARIHRYTLDRLRKEVEPVSSADFMRFLFVWHHLDPEYRVEGPMGLTALLDLLEGFQAPASAWENHLLPARMNRYNNAWLDQLCLSGAGGVGAVASSVELGRRTPDECAAQLAGGADIPGESLVSSGVGAGDVRRKGPAQRTWRAHTGGVGTEGGVLLPGACTADAAAFGQRETGPGRAGLVGPCDL